MDDSGESQKTHSKIVIAVEFLNTAADLWCDGSAYFAAMHLAAAAEELTGKACRHAGRVNHFDERVKYVTRAVDGLGLTNVQKRVSELMYGAKNSIKHFSSPEDAEVALVPRDEASNYIRGAYQNFCELGLQELLSAEVLRVLDATSFYCDIDSQGADGPVTPSV